MYLETPRMWLAQVKSQLFIYFFCWRYGIPYELIGLCTPKIICTFAGSRITWKPIIIEVLSNVYPECSKINNMVSAHSCILFIPTRWYVQDPVHYLESSYLAKFIPCKTIFMWKCQSKLTKLDLICFPCFKNTISCLG